MTEYGDMITLEIDLEEILTQIVDQYLSDENEDCIDFNFYGRPFRLKVVDMRPPVPVSSVISALNKRISSIEQYCEMLKTKHPELTDSKTVVSFLTTDVELLKSLIDEWKRWEVKE